MLITNKLLTGEKDHLSWFNLREKKPLYQANFSYKANGFCPFCKPNLHT